MTLRLPGISVWTAGYVAVVLLALVLRLLALGRFSLGNDEIDRWRLPSYPGRERTGRSRLRVTPTGLTITTGGEFQTRRGGIRERRDTQACTFVELTG